MLHEKYGVNRGGDKGNFQLKAYDGSLRLLISINDCVAFGPELQVAKENELYQVLSPNADDQGVWIHQDAWIFLGNYTEDKQETYKVQKEGNGVFFMVVEGEVECHPD